MAYAVLDASAVIALLRDEPGARMVETVLVDGRTTCAIHAINLCEVFYDAIRDGGIDFAYQILDDIMDLGIVISEDLAPPFWQTAGLLKSSFRASMADCFGMALARWLDADFYTADHHELDAIAGHGVCRIRFIR